MDLEIDFDPQTVCRICMAAGDNLLNLFARTLVNGELLPLPEMITGCLQIRIDRSDKLPAKLCNTCKSDVTQFYAFKQKSQRTDQLLRSMISPDPIVEDSGESSAEQPNSKPAVKLEPLPSADIVQPSAATIERECRRIVQDNNARSHQKRSATRSSQRSLIKRPAIEQKIEPITTDDLLDLLDEDRLDDSDSDENQPLDVEPKEHNEATDDEAVSYSTMSERQPSNVLHPDAFTDAELHEDHLQLDELETDYNDDESAFAGDFEGVDTEPEHDDAEMPTEDDSTALLFVCSACPAYFRAADELDEHLAAEHSLFRCIDCGKLLNSRSYLSRHRKSCSLVSLKQMAPYEAIDEDGRSEQPADGQSLVDVETVDLDVDLLDDDPDYEAPPVVRRSAPKRPRKTVTSTTRNDDDDDDSECTASGRKRRRANGAVDEALHCDICECDFDHRARYEQHVRIHEAMNVVSRFMTFHPCHQCRLIFPLGADLQRHRRRQHNEPATADESDETDSDAFRRPANGRRQPADDETGDSALPMSTDDDGYTDYQFLDDDGYEAGTDYQCGLCSAAFSTSQETKYHLVGHLDRFECPMAGCGFEYELFAHFVGHVNNKHINDACTCTHCGSELDSLDALRKHQQNECAERKWACSHCDKRFFSRKAMNNHLLWVKSDRHVCPECGKTFVQLGELHIHRRMHTDERPFVCTVCGKAYKTSSMRAAHMDSHIPGKTFQCPICQLMLQSRTTYRNHIARHSKAPTIKCGYCAKLFYTRYHRRLHETNVHKKDSTEAKAGRNAIEAADSVGDGLQPDDDLGLDTEADYLIGSEQ